MLEKLTKITPSDVVKVIFFLKRFRRSNVPCIAGRGLSVVHGVCHWYRLLEARSPYVEEYLPF